jgi:hypothetical protein
MVKDRIAKERDEIKDFFPPTSLTLISMKNVQKKKKKKLCKLLPLFFAHIQRVNEREIASYPDYIEILFNGINHIVFKKVKCA